MKLGYKPSLKLLFGMYGGGEGDRGLLFAVLAYFCHRDLNFMIIETAGFGEKLVVPSVQR